MSAAGLAPLLVTGRMDRLRAGFDDHGVDALLVTELANVRWLTGFTGSAGVVLVTRSAAFLTTDGRYRTQSGEQLEAAGAEGVEVTVGGVDAQRSALEVAADGAGRVGLESEHVSWAAQIRWAEALGAERLVPTQGAVEALRMVKDAAEIARIERAAAIADRALEEILPLLAAAGAGEPVAGPGGLVTERSLAVALDHAMRELGAEDSAFETIVASGPNAAKPHARPGERVIGPGDPVVVDFGAVFEGYRSDMTRTFCVGGEPTGELARVFAVVAEAQRTGVAAMAPGVEAASVDKAARDVIAEAGWADRFEHGTGHGVGLDIHEAPSVSPSSTAILAPGVVATVEPGVYLPGVGGVRIEDTLVVTEHGCRPLTTFAKEVAV